MNKKKNAFPSELRFDLINQDWVLIATGRAKRPEAFRIKRKRESKISKKTCPFCQIGENEKPILAFLNGKEIELKNGKIPKKWTTLVIPNKYPALLPAKKMRKKREGNFYQRIDGVGYCELVVTRDHKRHFPDFTVSEIKEVFDAYQKRYLDLMKKPFVNYISIFHNYGEEAGASQPHPHSQIITTPLIDVDLKKALSVAKEFFEKKKKCIYCEMNRWEEKVKKRIVCENEKFLAICPFASKTAFEVIISPKFHSPNFEKISENEKIKLAEIFGKVAKKISKVLKNPAYNFYLHTAPCDRKKYEFYHWHFTILPKTATLAGFELGTRIEISLVEPERAAKLLREA